MPVALWHSGVGQQGGGRLLKFLGEADESTEIICDILFVIHRIRRSTYNTAFGMPIPYSSIYLVTAVSVAKSDVLPHRSYKTGCATPVTTTPFPFYDHA